MVSSRFVASPRTLTAGILVRHYFEDIVGKGELSSVDGCVTPDVIFTSGYHPRPMRGTDALKRMIGELHEAFSGIIISEKVSISEGDIVATRWLFRATHTGTFLGVPPTNRAVRVAGMAFCRVSGNKIVEIWVTDDSLTMLTQLGAVQFV
jgi:steroid delta-isomerase-like uncharacterized protein